MNELTEQADKCLLGSLLAKYPQGLSSEELRKAYFQLDALHLYDLSLKNTSFEINLGYNIQQEKIRRDNSDFLNGFPKTITQRGIEYYYKTFGWESE